ncbi:MAG: DUF3343 domain-containing protein [Lachnospiraceae bacterium]
MIYLATFYSHFGAIRFKKECGRKKIKAAAMPVPRDLSSSCGTCVRFETDLPISNFQWSDEVEQVVEILERGYQIHFKQETT